MKKPFGSAENIADRAFLQSITLSIAAILLCIVALCSATYAWFVVDVASSHNTISAAFFDLKVTIVDTTVATPAPEETDPAEGDSAPESNADTAQSTPKNTELTRLSPTDGLYTLQAGHTYQVILTIPDVVTASQGYCDMYVLTTGETYRTAIIENRDTKSLSFTFTPAQDLQLLFLPQWGAPDYQGVQVIGYNAVIPAPAE